MHDHHHFVRYYNVHVYTESDYLGMGIYNDYYYCARIADRLEIILQRACLT